MDRLSNLPEELILHIATFLPSKEAALTNLLSKTYNNLINIEDLRFDGTGGASFAEFVKDLVDLQPSTRIRNFSVRGLPVNHDQSNLLNQCVRDVVKRGVLVLEVLTNVEAGYVLPREVFTCTTVKKLKLGRGFAIDCLPRDVSLPTLKTLYLDSVRFHTLGEICVFQALISACTVLEDLLIDGHNWEDWFWSQTVSSQTLKNLGIRRNDIEEQDGSSCPAISFDTPELVNLEYCDVLRDEYPVVRLNSLETARLDLPVSHAPEKYNARNLIKGLKNVRIMSLEHVDTMQLFDAVFDVVPEFERLRHLSMRTHYDYCCHGLILLLDKSRNLESLTIEELHYRYEDGMDWMEVCSCLGEYTSLRSCPIKFMKITEFRGRVGEMVQLKLILENSMSLQLLVIHVQGIPKEEEKAMLAQLVKLPRGSPKCEVEVKFASE